VKDIIKDLITKHLENWNGLKLTSIEHYNKTGKVSGSLLVALEAMMDEYKEVLMQQKSCKHRYQWDGDFFECIKCGFRKHHTQ